MALENVVGVTSVVFMSARMALSSAMHNWKSYPKTIETNWNNGVMECWETNRRDEFISSDPSFQFSSTPVPTVRREE